MFHLFNTSNLPENKWQPFTLTSDDCDYDSFLKLNEIKNDVLNFVNTGSSLYIFSRTTGNGKTSWAIKILQNYFNKIWNGNGFRKRALFIHVPSFLRMVTESFRKDSNADFGDIKYRLANDDLVVWDDIASTQLSPSDYKYLLSFIDQRILEGKSNIYTGNLNETNLESNLGPRLKSRVYDSSIKVELFGHDKRGR
jgi:DNA replication protein DnaC